MKINWTEITKGGDGWMYSSGPMNDLNTWQRYMERAGADGYLRGRYVFVHNTRQYPITDIHDLFPWDLWEEVLAANRGKQIVTVFDNTMEGPSWYHVSEVAGRMMGYGIDPRCIINWTGSIGEPGCPIQTVTLMDAFSGINYIEHCYPEWMPTHHFVMLARIPRDHRVLAAIELLGRGLERFGYASCGSGEYGAQSSLVYERLVPDDLRHRFPMLLPGESFSSIQTMEVTINSTTKPEVTGAFCNVVCETTHDLQHPNVCTAFATEKSEKAFLLEQVPIWIAAPGQVALIREWGFDTFDDIIDHGYDGEPDPHKRISLATDQLERICSRSMRHWQGYRSANRLRFTHNRERCVYLRENFREMQYHKLLRCMDLMPKAG